MNREERLTQAFIALADTLVVEFDVVEFLNRLAEVSVDLLRVDAAGVMLGDGRGDLRAMASSNDDAAILELFELQHAEGPCLDCYRTGEAVVNVDLGDGRWPRFAEAAARAGYASSHALPLRLRDQVIGSMNLFCVANEVLGETDVALGQALADIATIGLLQERGIREREVLAEQLQHALNSRILIEQAKGMLAERAQLSPPEAFATMRSYARGEGRPLTEVAAAIVDLSLDHEALLTR